MLPNTPLTPAQFDLSCESALHSTLYDDVYASADGAFAQAAHVFLGGNDLPQRWARAERFVIVETGFGAAVNFLATWEAWVRTAPAGALLHYISVEKHPFLRDDLARVLGRSSHCARLAAQLLEQYPLHIIPGFHRLTFPSGRIVLTLLFGDVLDALRELDARAQAFFLDGFAPAKNPRMWSDPVFAELARLAAPGATAASYTVAGAVRDGLQRAGFAVRNAPGFGRKQDMLCARFPGEDVSLSARIDSHHAIVIGAGLAGSACAAQLTARGFEVEVIERHAAAALEASGNPAGLVMPAFSLDWNLPTRLTVTAFLHAIRVLRNASTRAWNATGVLQLARDDVHFLRQRQIIQRYRLPQKLIDLVDDEEGADIIGQRVAAPGWWLACAGWADPRQLCRDLLRDVKCRFDCYAARLRSVQDGHWEIVDGAGTVIARAPLVILANAYAAGQLLGEGSLGLGVTRGQVSFVPQTAGASLHAPVCRDGYVTPAAAGLHCVGASYNVGSDDLSERLDDHVGNLQRLQHLLPGYAAGTDPGRLTGRVAVRTVAQDRMPLLGRWPGPPGLYTCLGLASRGITVAPLLAETLACTITGEPLPMERSLLARLAPERFVPALQSGGRSW